MEELDSFMCRPLIRYVDYISHYCLTATYAPESHKLTRWYACSSDDDHCHHLHVGRDRLIVIRIVGKQLAGRCRPLKTGRLARYLVQTSYLARTNVRNGENRRWCASAVGTLK